MNTTAAFDAATFTRRAGLLAEHPNTSVAACLADAHAARAAAETNAPFPGTATTETAELWYAAAERWITRAAQHAYGFALPRGW